jgi:Ca2+-binding RTX toxin-like protein
VLNGGFATDEAGVDRVYGSDVDPRAVANPNIVAISDGLRSIISSKDSTITGKTEFFLNGTRSDVRTQETNLGNLTADANLAYAQQIDPTVTLSLKNGGGIRDNIGTVSAAPGATDADDVQKLPPQPNPLAPNKQAGDVSQLDIENSLRFNNGLSLITVTVAQLKQLLEHGVAETAPGATPGRFPQVGGLAFSFDPTRAATEDLNGNGVLDAGEDRNGNGILDAGQRIRNVALVDDRGRVTAPLVQDGAIVGDANRTFRMVTLNFLAGTTPGSTTGGDGYPFPQFVAANPTLANRVDLTGETTADLNGNGVIDAAPALPAGQFTFAPTGSEQDALAEYLAQIGSYDQQDTDPTQDRRIQNLSVRGDTILTRGRRITGTSEADELRGTSGDDLLLGLGGPDRLLGGRGNDELVGGRGADRLSGGRGRDILIGGLGSDVLRGNQGSDIFVLERGRGVDTIADYQEIDRLQLGDGLRFGSLTIEDTDGGALISFRNDALAVLRGISADQITRSDFVSAA